jgi:hypothetical protein
MPLNRTANSLAPGPRSALVHHAPLGPGAKPSSAGLSCLPFFVFQGSMDSIET